MSANNNSYTYNSIKLKLSVNDNHTNAMTNTDNNIHVLDSGNP